MNKKLVLTFDELLMLMSLDKVVSAFTLEQQTMYSRWIAKGSYRKFSGRLTLFGLPVLVVEGGS